MRYEGVVGFCSRGLNHSRTFESIWRNLEGRRDKWEIVFSHNRKIPDAQNYVTSEALRLYNPEFILYVEEDNVPAFHAVREMIKASNRYPVVTLDYPLEDGRPAVYIDEKGKINYGGMGCLLIKSKIFDLIKKPWFDTVAYTLDGGILNMRHKYGGQDVYIYKRLIESGVSIGVLDVPCNHLRVDEYGSPGVNNGVHKISKLNYQ